MWLAEVDPSVGTANVWLLLITIVSSGATLATTWILHRRGKNPASRDAADDAVRQYRRLFVDPLHRENERLRQLLEECEGRDDD